MSMTWKSYCANWYVHSFSKSYKAPKAMAIWTEIINIGLQVSLVDETQTYIWATGRLTNNTLDELKLN